MFILRQNHFHPFCTEPFNYMHALNLFLFDFFLFSLTTLLQILGGDLMLDNVIFPKFDTISQVYVNYFQPSTIFMLFSPLHLLLSLSL